MARLFILRHAEAEPKLWAEDTPEDFMRRLEPIGHRQAAASGIWVKQQVSSFDFVLCSGSARTRETLASAFSDDYRGWDVVYDNAIYDIGADQMMEFHKILHQVPAAAQTVLLVGHNPTAPQLALDIDKGANPELYQQLDKAFGKSAVVELDIHGSWKNIPACGGRMKAVYTPHVS